MTETSDTTTTDATTAGDATPPAETRARRGGRPAPAPAPAPADASSDDDGDRQIVKPNGFMIDHVDVAAADGEGTVRIDRGGIEVDRAEAERLVDTAGKGPNGRNVLRRHKAPAAG